MITLKNKEIEVEISEIGAEIQSIKYQGIERLWNGDEAIWPKRSPVLFPVIGQTKDQHYFIDGVKYGPIENHGFLRYAKFEVIEKTLANSFVELRYTQNEETLKVYPYSFELVITYGIQGNSIYTTWIVKNESEKEMYFTIGGHPGFVYDLGNNETYLDYIVKFEEPVDYSLYEFTPLIGPKKIYCSAKKTFFNMTELIKKHNVVVFENIETATLLSNTGHEVRIDLKGVPFLAFWQNHLEDPKFLCMEPWCGLPDPVDSNQNFKEKPTNIVLEPGKKYKNGYHLSFK